MNEPVDDEIIHLDTEDLLYLVDDLQVGPLRDLGLLDSAAHRPSARVFGTQAYPDINLQAAALLESLVRSHPLVDGNKRLGWLAVAVFYQVNGYVLAAPDDPAYQLVISVAEGSMGVRTIADQLSEWTIRA